MTPLITSKPSRGGTTRSAKSLPLMVADGLSKTFRMGDARLAVLRDATFELWPGEFVAIEGRSGSGKSTLLHVLAALDSVDQGRLVFDGQDYTRRPPRPPPAWLVGLIGGPRDSGRAWWARVAVYAADALVGLSATALGWDAVMRVGSRLVGSTWRVPTQAQTVWAALGVALLGLLLTVNVLRLAIVSWVFARAMHAERPSAKLRNRQFGFVFQSYHLLPELTVLQNALIAPMIEFSSAQYGGRRADLRGRAVDLLTRLGMGERLGHLPSQLSGGERQRVAIARALMNEPAVLFADEPTGNLDYETGRQIMDLLEALHREHGQTIVMVTHDRSLAREADRVLVLRDGKLEPAE